MTSKLVIALAFAGAVVAQTPQDPVQLAEQKRLAERALQRVTADLERLIDMRLRHDLGLIAGLDQDVVHVEGEVTSRAMDRMRGELKELQAHNDVLAGEYDGVQQLVAKLNQQAGGSAPVQVPTAPFVQRPPTERSALQPAYVGAGDVVAADTTAIQADPVPAAPLGETQRATVDREALGALALDPVQNYIDGSEDHLRVARALYQAGQALVDRGATLRRHGRQDAADALDERAKQRLERAIAVLEPVTSGDDAPFATLFYLSRCRELMFRIDERGGRLSLQGNRREYQSRSEAVRAPLLRITGATEEQGVSGDQEWRQAAKTAMAHFRWMNLHGSYDVTDKIKELTWPGKK